MDDTYEFIESLFPDLESTPQPQKNPEKSAPLCSKDFLDLMLSLEEKVDKASARRMLLHHVEPALKSYVPRTSQEAPLFLKLSQQAALKGKIEEFEAYLTAHLKELKQHPQGQVIVEEELTRVIH